MIFLLYYKYGRQILSIQLSLACRKIRCIENPEINVSRQKKLEQKLQKEAKKWMNE